MSYTGEIERDGFAILENAVDSNKLRLLEKNCSTSTSNTRQSTYPPNSNGLKSISYTKTQDAETRRCGPFSVIIRTLFNPTLREWNYGMRSRIVSGH
jgi:hypothetical protein